MAVQWKQVRVPTDGGDDLVHLKLSADLYRTWPIGTCSADRDDTIGRITYVNLTAVESCIPPPMPIAGNDADVRRGDDPGSAWV